MSNLRQNSLENEERIVWGAMVIGAWFFGYMVGCAEQLAMYGASLN